MFSISKRNRIGSLRLKRHGHPVKSMVGGQLLPSPNGNIPSWDSLATDESALITQKQLCQALYCSPEDLPALGFETEHEIPLPHLDGLIKELDVFEYKALRFAWRWFLVEREYRSYVTGLGYIERPLPP